MSEQSTRKVMEVVERQAKRYVAQGWSVEAAVEKAWRQVSREVASQVWHKVNG